ncbi:MAG TPA: hypothetical protein VN903_31395 [Polyangia bacterium]|jgi:hypothetical protein|nr:hypothetical protein [Polyangia bacterium]
MIVLVAFAGSTGLARAETPVLPKRMVYEPGQAIPAGYHVEHRTRYGLAISGSIMFGLTYIPTAAAAWYDSRDGTPLYVVPILGPLLAIPAKTRDTCVEGDHNPCFNFDDFIIGFFVADAVMQATGAILAWRGFAGRDLLIRNETTQATVVPGPVGPNGYGAWLTGRF